MRWPGVVVSAQVHAFLLGYLSGQLGLVMTPVTLFTVWSQPAVKRHHWVNTDLCIMLKLEQSNTRVNVQPYHKEKSLRWNTFFTVVFVLMQHKATSALTAVAPKGVDTLMLTATVLLRALIFVWGNAEDTTLATVPFLNLTDSSSKWLIEKTCDAVYSTARGLTWEELRFKALFGHCIVWFELNAHVVVLGGDSFWFLCPTELPM